MPMSFSLRQVALAALLGAAALAAQAAAVEARIPAIQGRGATSPLVGQQVITTGVVTKVLAAGFFLQDLTGDGDELTSDGVYVYTSSTPTVSAGQYVRLTGTVTEYNTGATSNADTAAHTVTELTGISGLTVLGSGYSISPVTVTLPEAVNDDLERYEGMLVTLSGPLTVAQNYFLARYGQLTLAAGGRLETPTNRYRPGTAQAQALADANARRRIVLDDGSTLQNPRPTPYAGSDGTPRAGDTVASVTGVIDYGLATASNTGYGDYKIHPTVAPSFSAGNPRSTAQAAVGGNVKLASFNVLNYFTTFTDGRSYDQPNQTGQGCTEGSSTSAGNCRGASNLSEFLRQRDKIVEAMAAINADALGLMEIQNNGSVAVQNLVDALNARVGAGTYAAVPSPAAGSGSDAIKVAMIYKPARLIRVGDAVSDTAAVNNRPTLAQTFRGANGERFTLVVNHLKSKGSCPSAGDADAAGNTDAGDGQGCWNAQRVAQAQRLKTFVAQLQSSSGSNDVLLVGDFNAYAQEDPIFALTGSGYVDQIGRYNSLGYSYVFDGAAGRLDQAITTASMSPKVMGALHWHINADESPAQDYNLEYKYPLNCATGRLCPDDPYTVSPYRASDHDPVVLGLSLFKTIRGTAGRDTLVGSAGDDLLIGGAGADTLTGGAGLNVFAYADLRDAGDSITDFVPGKDQIDLRTLLAAIGADPATAWTRGVVRLVASGAHTLLQIDTDGSAGAAAPRTLATLLNLSPLQISPARDLGVQ